MIGSPAARPDLFVWSSGHGHYHLKDFSGFLLFNAAGSPATVGYKQAFCAIDIERVSPTASPSGRFHDCNSDQGISAGWADVYSSFLACQFVVIDGLANGDYTLQSTTNAQHRVGEDCLGDKTMWDGAAARRKYGAADRLVLHPRKTGSPSTARTSSQSRSGAAGRLPRAITGCSTRAQVNGRHSGP